MVLVGETPPSQGVAPVDLPASSKLLVSRLISHRVPSVAYAHHLFKYE